MDNNSVALFTLPGEIYYTDGVKLLLCGGTLYKNDASGRVFIHLKLKNPSSRTIKGIKVGFTLYDYLGEQIGEEREYTYIDLSGNFGVELCGDTPVYLKDKNTRSFSIRILEIGYSDNKEPAVESYDFKQEWVQVPSPNLLNTKFDEESERQYKMEFGGECKYLPKRFDEFVLCACGAVGIEDEGNCSECGCSYAAIINADLAAISEKARIRVEKAKEEERIRIEKQQEEARIRAEKAKEQIDKIKAFLIKYKKQLIIGTSSLIALIVVISIISSYVTKLGIYNDAILARGENRFDDSIELLEEISGFKDSETLIAEISTERENYLAYGMAEDYFKAGEYKEAVKAFENLGEYKDSTARIDEVVGAVIKKAREKANKNSFGEASMLISQVEGYLGVDEATVEIYDKWADFIISGALENEALTAESFKDASDRLTRLVPDYVNKEAKIEAVDSAWREHIGTMTETKQFDAAYPLAKEYAACYPTEEGKALYESMDEEIIAYADELAASGSYYEAINNVRILLEDYPDIAKAKQKELLQSGAKALASRGVLGDAAKLSLLFHTIAQNGCVLTDEGGVLFDNKIYGYGNVSVSSDSNADTIFALRVDGKVVCYRYIKEQYQGLVDILQTDVNSDIVSMSFSGSNMILVKADGTVRYYKYNSKTVNKKTTYEWKESDIFSEETEIAYVTDTKFLYRKNGTVAFDEYWVADVHKNTFKQLSDVRKIVSLNLIAPSLYSTPKQMFICLKNNGTIQVIENGHNSFSNASISRLKNMGLNDIVDVDYDFSKITFVKSNGSYFTVDEDYKDNLIIGEAKSVEKPINAIRSNFEDAIIYEDGKFEYDGKIIFESAMIYKD